MTENEQQEEFELDWETISKNRKNLKDQINASTVVTGDAVEVE